ncbi:hypothetical protein BW716_19055 [[Flexibacter] sp. ATCC 35208]|nr:hypothetical protein BW716_19055 [[Flexibacter] sp. ATCC 35208]
MAVPFVGFEPLLYVSASPSASVPMTLPLYGVSSGVVTIWLKAVGASFTGVTVMLIVIITVPPLPSLISIVKLSAPM